MKLCRPPGCSAVSHAGQSIEIDRDGCIDVDEEAASALLAHGFRHAPEAEAGIEPAQQVQDIEPLPVTSPDYIDRLKRNELFAFLKANGVSVSLPITNEGLRILAQRVSSDPAIDDAMKGS